MKKSIFATLLLFCLAGCSQSNEVDTTTDACSAPQTLSVGFEETLARVAIDESNKLYWDSGDEISYFCRTTDNLQYRYSGESGVKSATFNRVSDNALEGAAIAQNYAVYPYSSATTIAENGTISYTLPAVQNYAESSFGSGANTMVAVSESDNLYFRSVAGFLVLQLYGTDVTVSSIELKGNNSEKIAGAVTITASTEAAPTVDLSQATGTTITLNCDSGIKLSSDSTKPTEFWFVVPPVTFNGGFTVTVTDTAGNKFIKSTGSKVVIGRNTVQPMAAIEAIPVAKVGNTLPPWSEGYLDIHFINSGRGECCFYILPDGTTLLVDAGEILATYNASSNSEDAVVEQRPNTSTRPYMVYAKYIKHFMPFGRESIDWCAPSHFHIDHIGSPDAATETASATNGGYKKAGLLALFDEVGYNKILDRLYPDYNTNDDGTVTSMNGALKEDYVKFVNWGVANNKFTAARFAVGEEQITLQYNKSAYDNFRILNICGNGDVWTKTGAVNKHSGNGNPASCGFHLTYGNFDYIACGDLTSGPQNTVAYYVRDFIGDGKFEAFKCHHHLSSNAWGTQMREDANFFEPQVIVSNSLYKKHCDPGLLNEFITGESWYNSFFATNLHPKYISANSSLVSKFSGYNGHIVIRVEPGGANFRVYVLDDTDFNYNVKSIHGPYTSK